MNGFGGKDSGVGDDGSRRGKIGDDGDDGGLGRDLVGDDGDLGIDLT